MHTDRDSVIPAEAGSREFLSADHVIASAARQSPDLRRFPTVNRLLTTDTRLPTAKYTKYAKGVSAPTLFFAWFAYFAVTPSCHCERSAAISLPARWLRWVCRRIRRGGPTASAIQRCRDVLGQARPRSLQMPLGACPSNAIQNS